MKTTIQGCSVHYELSRCADSRAPVVLFLHGWGCDGTVFSFITSGFAADATAITLDFPGHGQSGEPPEPWGVFDYAEMVRELLRQLSFARVSIISHSFGSRVAIHLASKSPELVERLVITGGAGIRPPVSPRQSQRTKRFKRYNAMLSKLGTIAPLSPVVEKWQTSLRNRFGSADYVKLDEVMRKTFIKVISEDLLPMLPQIKASTLLIWGSMDTETPLWMGQQMEQSIPDAGLVVFEEKSHFAFVEDWRRFVLITRKFLLEE